MRGIGVVVLLCFFMLCYAWSFLPLAVHRLHSVSALDVAQSRAIHCASIIFVYITTQ